MDPIMGIEIFFSIVSIIGLLVWILSKGLTSIIALSVLIPTALILTIINAIEGESVGAAIWGFNLGIFLASLAVNIIIYNKNH